VPAAADGGASISRSSGRSLSLTAPGEGKADAVGKACHFCGKVLTRKKGENIGDWESRRFCNIKCSGPGIQRERRLARRNRRKRDDR
jgi:hypothetical protein